MRHLKNRNVQGFSLVELMVALVAGMIVAGAVLAFTMSSLNANTAFITSTRLTQELRSNLTFVTDELRRAGYDEDSLGYVGQPATAGLESPFARIFYAEAGGADNGCVVFAYDRLPGTPGALELGNGEIRAFRRRVRSVNGRSVGVLEFAQSAAGITPQCDASGDSPDYTTYPVGCNETSGWCAISDPRVLNVETFRISGNDQGVITGNAATVEMQVRRLEVVLRGSLIGDASVTRGARSRIRVRADCVRSAAAANCTQMPVGV